MPTTSRGRRRAAGPRAGRRRHDDHRHRHVDETAAGPDGQVAAAVREAQEHARALGLDLRESGVRRRLGRESHQLVGVPVLDGLGARAEGLTPITSTCASTRSRCAPGCSRGYWKTQASRRRAARAAAAVCPHTWRDPRGQGRPPRPGRPPRCRPTRPPGPQRPHGRDGVANLDGDLLGLCRRRTGEKHGKLVAADPHDEIGPANAPCTAVATRRSSSSPAECPSLSFTRLKPSRSSASSEPAPPLRCNQSSS